VPAIECATYEHLPAIVFQFARKASMDHTVHPLVVKAALGENARDNSESVLNAKLAMRENTVQVYNVYIVKGVIV
jgi:hypothetical protein